MKNEKGANNNGRQNNSRRQFAKILGAGVAGIPLASLLSSLPSHAADAPMVDPAAPAAVALQYMEASDKEGKSCATCTLYQGSEGEAGGGCPLFAGSSVAASAWCSAWVPKA